MIDLEVIKKDIPQICEQFGVAYVDVYGSVARSEQSENSDLDLIIEFKEPRREQLSARFFGFLHEIEDRFQVKVDLLTEKSIKNPFFQQAVNRERVRLYG